MLINKENKENGNCIECGKPATMKHLLGSCKVASGMTIKRHDIIVEEIYVMILIKNYVFYIIFYLNQLL